MYIKTRRTVGFNPGKDSNDSNTEVRLKQPSDVHHALRSGSALRCESLLCVTEGSGCVVLNRRSVGALLHTLTACLLRSGQ